MGKQILSCDWGTSMFRLRLIRVDDGAVLNEVISEQGIAAMYSEWMQANKPERERTVFYRAFLQSVIDEYFSNCTGEIPLIISGMASSANGMKELAYGEIPFDLPGKELVTERMPADDTCRHEILLVSGLKTGNDVMRGEETMLLGCTIKAGEHALAIFPGTHSKHVTIANNAVVDLKTFMTGEMFHLLSTKSILSGSVIKNNRHDLNHFTEGVKEGISSNFLNSIFQTRTNHLFKKLTAEENYHFLSGLLIGSELKEIPPGIKIYLVCNDNLAEQYVTALKILNVDDIEHCNADEALIKAHCNLSHLLHL